MTDTITRDAAVAGMFMMEGLNDATAGAGFSGYRKLMEAYGEGRLELAHEVLEYGVLADKMATKARGIVGQVSGLLEYEVCTNFGAWLYPEICEHKGIPKEKAVKALTDSIIAFHSQDGSYIVSLVAALAPENLDKPEKV